MGLDMHLVQRRAKGGLRSAAHFIWPSRSLVSGRHHGGIGLIAPEDFARLSFLGDSGCRQCALPLDTDLGEESLCGKCAAKPPRWDAARAALAYDDTSRKLVLDLKHAGRRDGLTTFASWMTQAAGDLLEEADLIVPVPLHYRRLVKRGFNQSGWLAQGLARKSGIPASIDTLVRRKPTPSQGGLSARERWRNVRAAFAVRDGARARIEGARILLVDDVFTTGATLSACSLALRRAGAAHIGVVVLARVVRPSDVTI
ncbi:MAG: amidophosphoribosyltransferase [Henriciella sp.]|jgi:ComF family protein|uniref:ComF family protein n=1 Tax=Henriciella sp. TaxID=1968823 RepID=UPI000C10079C|nr:ComF family protein [Henriciella sp.]MAN72595.1 amidophosphoribosyltransferase [Henriciella sp.]MBK74947.1 amidophosphoribosyltransferase [Henriciella sp.]PHR82963.1 MAG: amidophosphoribosyltransferase [Henriciella sp.]|tara:strand:- start:2275 stop:3045 length:771 start_codon:yes stop_codon:yes gene_type:complete